MIKYTTLQLTTPHLDMNAFFSSTLLTVYLCLTILFLMWYALYMLYTGAKFRKRGYQVELAVTLVTLTWPYILYWKIKDVITEHKDVLR